MPDEPAGQSHEPIGQAPQADPRLVAFITHLRTERQLSPHTCLNYERDITALLRLAGISSVESLSGHQIRRFIATLHGRGLSGTSLARMLSAWRGFYAYLARQHAITRNPCAGIRPPKSAKRLPAALSPDEAVRLVTIEGTDPLVRRDRAMFELLYSSGLRLAELTGANVVDVAFDAGEITVTGKGSKTRIVPVGQAALDALSTWLPERERLAVENEPALFVSRNGRRISPRAVQQRVKLWGIKQGVGSPVHPHVLRHSFASHLLQSSGDLRAVQEMLGHASIASTQVYTHLDFQHLAKVYDQAHPRAKKK